MKSLILAIVMISVTLTGMAVRSDETSMNLILNFEAEVKSTLQSIKKVALQQIHRDTAEELLEFLKNKKGQKLSGQTLYAFRELLRNFQNETYYNYRRGSDALNIFVQEAASHPYKQFSFDSLKKKDLPLAEAFLKSARLEIFLDAQYEKSYSFIQILFYGISSQSITATHSYLAPPVAESYSNYVAARTAWIAMTKPARDEAFRQAWNDRSAEYWNSRDLGDHPPFEMVRLPEPTVSTYAEWLKENKINPEKSEAGSLYFQRQRGRQLDAMRDANLALAEARTSLAKHFGLSSGGEIPQLARSRGQAEPRLLLFFAEKHHPNSHGGKAIKALNRAGEAMNIGDWFGVIPPDVLEFPMAYKKIEGINQNLLALESPVGVCSAQALGKAKLRSKP